MSGRATVPGLPLAAFAAVTVVATACLTGPAAATAPSASRDPGGGNARCDLEAPYVSGSGAHVDEGATSRVTVAIEEPGTYAVRYQVDYPETPGRVRTFLEGARLRPDTRSPARPDRFAVFVCGTPVELEAGSHRLGYRGIELPSPIGGYATLHGPLQSD